MSRSRDARQNQITTLENRAADHFNAADSYEQAGPGWDSDAAASRVQGARAASHAAEARGRGRR